MGVGDETDDVQDLVDEVGVDVGLGHLLVDVGNEVFETGEKVLGEGLKGLVVVAKLPQGLEEVDGGFLGREGVGEVGEQGFGVLGGVVCVQFQQ